MLGTCDGIDTGCLPRLYYEYHLAASIGNAQDELPRLLHQPGDDRVVDIPPWGDGIQLLDPGGGQGTMNSVLLAKTPPFWVLFDTCMTMAPPMCSMQPYNIEYGFIANE